MPYDTVVQVELEGKRGKVQFLFIENLYFTREDFKFQSKSELKAYFHTRVRGNCLVQCYLA